MSDDQKQPESVDSKISNQTEFHFVYSPLFRTVYSDGAWFNPDLGGTMRLTFFNTHTPIPDKTDVKFDNSGNITETKNHFSKTGNIREMEVDVVMTLASALEFHQILGRNIKNLQAAITQTIPDKFKTAITEAMK